MTKDFIYEFGGRRTKTIFGIPVITIENIESKDFFVTDCVVHQYGVGNSIQEAVDDYKITVKAYYASLQEDEGRLGSDLNLCYLRKVFEEINNGDAPQKNGFIANR